MLEEQFGGWGTIWEQFREAIWGRLQRETIQEGEQFRELQKESHLGEQGTI